MDDRPPKEDGCKEKAGVLDFVPRGGSESEFECGRNMPGYKGDGGENPTNDGMIEKFSKGPHGWPAQERSEGGPDEPLRHSVEKR